MRFLAFLALLTGCGAKNPAEDIEAAPQATRQLELMHGIGFICRSPNGTLEPRLYCWATDQASLNNGDAAFIGVTSLAPQVIAEPAGGIITIHIKNQGVCWVGPGGVTGGCFGDVSGTDQTHAEAVTCDVTGRDSLACPAALTFPGDVFTSYFPYDPRTKHYPHSFEYYQVRKTA